MYEKLMPLAREARKKAYCRYSGFSVGAALLGGSGKIYTGCNVENASYGATCCAERTAFFTAISEGERDFVAIAVSGGKGEGETFCPPCGICRQVMAELCSFDFTVILQDDCGKPFMKTLSELLPLAFNNDRMEESP